MSIGTGLAALSIDALDDLSRSMVVSVDNAVRTSIHELDLAVEGFGEQRTEAGVLALDAREIPSGDHP